MHSLQAKKSIVWSIGANFFPKVLQPLVMIILARILYPEDFGIIATSMVLISLGVVISSAGLGEALIQIDEKELYTFMNTIFWLNIFLGLFIYTLIYIYSYDIALYYNDERLDILLSVLGVSLIFTSATTVQHSYLKRIFDFKSIMFISLLPSIFSILVTIPLAYFGYGYWALAIGTLVSSILSFFTYFLKTKFRPTFNIDISGSLPSIKIALIILIEALLGWIIMRVDVAMIASHYSQQEVGFFYFAQTLLAVSFGVVMGALYQVIYPYFSRVNEYEKDIFNKKISDIIEFVSLFTYFFIGLVILLAPIFIPLLFGENWIEAVVLVQILSIGSISWIFMVIPEAFKALGLPQILLKINIIQAIATPIVYYLFIDYGLEVFVASKLLLSWIFIAHLYYAYRHFGYNSFFRDSFSQFIFFGILILLMFLFTQLFNSLEFYCVTVLFYLIISFFYIKYFKNKQYMRILHLFKNKGKE